MKPHCPRKAIKIGLTVSFVITGLVAIMFPEYGFIVAAAGVAQNTVWLWEA